jgi:hypothetical protein
MSHQAYREEPADKIHEALYIHTQISKKERLEAKHGNDEPS